MLTHLHMLVHTWWCWHTLRRRWRLKVREGFGFLSPSRRACEKIKCIFSIALMETLKKLWECFSLEKYSLDAGLGGTGRCSWVSGALSFLAEVKGAPDAQHWTVVRHCWCIRCGMTSASEYASVSDCIGRSGSVRWCESGDSARLTTSLRTCPVCIGHVRCLLNRVR